LTPETRWSKLLRIEKAGDSLRQDTPALFFVHVAAAVGDLDAVGHRTARGRLDSQVGIGDHLVCPHDPAGRPPCEPNPASSALPPPTPAPTRGSADSSTLEQFNRCGSAAAPQPSTSRRRVPRRGDGLRRRGAKSARQPVAQVAKPQMKLPNWGFHLTGVECRDRQSASRKALSTLARRVPRLVSDRR